MTWSGGSLARLEGLRMRVATGLGAGYAPIAPGTAGSLLGLLLVWALWRWGGHWTVLAGAAVVSLAGWCRTVDEKLFVAIFSQAA